MCCAPFFILYSSVWRINDLLLLLLLLSRPKKSVNLSSVHFTTNEIMFLFQSCAGFIKSALYDNKNMKILKVHIFYEKISFFILIGILFVSNPPILYCNCHTKIAHFCQLVHIVSRKIVVSTFAVCMCYGGV